MSAHDWGPAFAEQNPEILRARMESLRDWFAGQALIGILGARNGFLVDVGTDNAPVWAYQVADAMLRARAEKGVGT